MSRGYGRRSRVAAIVEIGVLAGVILVLAVSALLLRVREEKPAEEDETVGSRG